MLSKFNPEAVIVNTKSSLVPAVTGMFNPDNVPLAMSPILIIPLSDGASVTVVPEIGVKILLGTVDSYNCASIVILVLTNVSPRTTLK